MRLTATRTIWVGLLSLSALAAPAVAEPSPETSGRYSMSPVDGGFLRLDKETGAVAMCAKSGNDWACKPVEDQTAAGPSTDLSRLENENKELKGRVKQLEDLLETKPPATAPPPPAADAPFPGGPPGGISRLPTDEEVDQALDYLSRVYKKVRERIKDLDKPLPPDDHAAPLSPPPPPPPASKGSL